MQHKVEIDINQRAAFGHSVKAKELLVKKTGLDWTRIKTMRKAKRLIEKETGLLMLEADSDNGKILNFVADDEKQSAEVFQKIRAAFENCDLFMIETRKAGKIVLTIPGYVLVELCKKDSFIKITPKDEKKTGITPPQELCCPITKTIMVKPVVYQNGISYEQSAIKNNFAFPGKSVLNRALQALIALFHEESHFESSALTDILSCPITLELMNDPVICLVDGYTYEREAIEDWLSKNSTSPMTHAPVHDGNLLVPNLNLKKAIDNLTSLEVNRRMNP